MVLMGYAQSEINFNPKLMIEAKAKHYVKFQLLFLAGTLIILTGCEKKQNENFDPISVVEEVATSSEVITQEPSEISTEDWKTYRNEEFGFEVKYPRGWDYVTFPTIERVVFVPYNIKEKYTINKDEADDGSLFMTASRESVMFILPNLKLDEAAWIQENNEHNERVAVGELIGIKYIGITGGQEEGTILSVGDAIHITKNDTLYEIYITRKRYSDNDKVLVPTIDNMKLIDAMLSTFKFKK